MCGLTGFFDPRRSSSRQQMQGVIDAMTATLRHRGPDDDGTWLDPEAGIALGFRRLAVIDLTRDGHQPMASASERYVMVFNGEIYNHPVMRQELEKSGHPFRGHSDSETLLAAFEAWGVRETIERSNGMFALVVWDREQRRLQLARDRLGEKPLYYGMQGSALLFGSELKALRQHPAFDGAVDRDVLSSYLRHGCVPSPHCIHAGLRKLPPGTILTVDGGQLAGELEEPVAYWSATAAAERGVASRLSADDPDGAVDALEEVLRDAVRIRMAADVPLGAFLSGGIDSSTVVALMQAQSEGPVKTFTIGFAEASSNEAHDALAVARHLGTDHTELYVTPEDSLALIPSLPDIYDEPFADASQLPTCLVSRLARQHVTVSLSGDGGDELFGGYVRHANAPAIWRLLDRTPRALRGVLRHGIDTMRPAAWGRFLETVAPLLPSRFRHRHPADKVQKLREILGASSPDELYLSLVSYWKQPAALIAGSTEPRTAASPGFAAGIESFAERMMLADTVTYLPDDILTKLDRATMAVSLEGRVPLLDHRVVELAWRLPLELKVRHGQGKWVLRRLLSRYVPEALFDRPKKGFDAPIGQWLRGPLRGWAEALLDEARLRREGFFAPAPIRQVWAEHLSGRRNAMDQLWAVLMFQAWLERW